MTIRPMNFPSFASPLLFCALLACDRAGAQGTPVTADLVADVTAIVPGRTFTVGLRLRMAPGWHTYWREPGDSGAATSIRWELPPGFETGGIQWPSPLRHTEPGDLKVNIYQKEVVLLIPVAAPETLVGETVTLKATAGWLACERSCVPGSADLELVLPVAQTAAPANAEIFTDSRGRIPLVKPTTTAPSKAWKNPPAPDNATAIKDLKPGDPAPPLQVANWVKGTPVASLGHGKIHVVEFWATWCPPCKESIPHLTELAHRYAGKVTFTGVSIYERPVEETDECINRMVVPFVEAMGDRMDYHVAVDGIAEFMAKNWMEPSKAGGIPTAFIINGEGIIAWIGHPEELEQALEKITTGTWDIAAEAQRRQSAQETAKNSPANKAMEAIAEVRKTRDDSAWIIAVANAEQAVPELAQDPGFISIKLEPLLRADPAAAKNYIHSLTVPGGMIAKDADLVWYILRVIAKIPEPGNCSPQDWRAIAGEIEPMMTSKEHASGSIYASYADVLSRAGEREKALASQQKAVDLFRAVKEKRYGVLNKLDVELLRKNEARLEEMLSAARN